MKLIGLVLLICAAGFGQTPSSKVEFDAAVIKVAAPVSGHFGGMVSSSGGPGTQDPTTFRCSNCKLSFLIPRAFALEGYQFPGKSGLPDTAFEISARVPEGATPAEFLVMLQNLLKDRFGLAYHFDKKQLQGYEMLGSKSGAKLKEAKDSAAAGGPEAEAHGGGAAAGNWHGAGKAAPARQGVTFFNGQARYRGDGQTTAELARVIATQLGRPVDDHTGLAGKYDIALSWADDGSHAASHGATGPGGAWGGGGHGDAGHGGDGGADGAPGVTLVGALQSQLGLKLEKKMATASIFTVDRVEKTQTAN